MIKRVRSQLQASEISFHEKSKKLHCLTRCVALRFENLSTSSRYFSESKDLSLDGLAKDSPNKLYLPKQMGEDQLDNLELDVPITLRILDGTAWNFTLAK